MARSQTDPTSHRYTGYPNQGMASTRSFGPIDAILYVLFDPDAKAGRWALFLISLLSISVVYLAN
jgi:hypothetical protein